MIQQQYPSQLLEKAVAEFSKLPGIGRKTALRLVLWMLRQDDADIEQFAEAIHRLKHEVKYCHICHNVSDADTCPICADPRRDAATICVVENIQEVILALSPTMEGDTTNFYIYRKLSAYQVKISVIARGISVGNELEYTDEVTLGRSITNRTLFEEK